MAETAEPILPTGEDLLEFEFVELDEEEFEPHLRHSGVEQPDNFTGPDQLRKKGVVLCGTLVEAAHGKMKHEVKRSIHNKTPEVIDPCTLIIFEWYVHTTKPGQRVKFARIDMRFRSEKESTGQEDEGKYDPWVKGLAPRGMYALNETDKTLESTKSWKPTIKVGQEGIANAELPFVYELKTVITQKEHILVDGYALAPKDGSYGHPDRFSSMQWTLSENKGQASDIPRYFRTAVLVNRAEAGPDVKFWAEVTIKVKVSTWEDIKGKVQSLLCRLGEPEFKDDNLVFNPALPPKTDRFDDKLGDLNGGVNMEDEMGFWLFKSGK